ncbi:MAG TPA: hypothetical protein VF552_09475 [Allosphingosinicella sp.]|jgi:hypothetical protein
MAGKSRRRGGSAAAAGSRIRTGKNRRLQRVKAGGYYWSEQAEVLFFDVLAASCNVRAAAAAVGFTTFTVYRLRRLRTDFAEKWQAALEQGYARLEMALVQAAADTLGGIEFDADRPIPKMSVDEALNLLKLHKAEVRGERAGRPGRFATPRGIEHYRTSILRKIEAIRRMRGEQRGEQGCCPGCGRARETADAAEPSSAADGPGGDASAGSESG